MKEIKRHLWWVCRHLQWVCEKAQTEPETLDRQQALKLLAEAEQEFEFARKLLEQ
ncbi:unnamed protein product [marine sediment metagenome]|uniref:HEPN domain-containing protein n=1 Tax=marine sediment metagenome TaxID=412755 RepID=X1FPW8_9ZZZZ